MHPSSNETQQPATEQRVIRMHELIRITSLSRSTIWRLIKAGDFVSPISLGHNSIGFLATEVYLWLENRPRAK